MRSTVSVRVELAKLCSSRDWSKAIRILDSVISQSCAIQDIWWFKRLFEFAELQLLGVKAQHLRGSALKGQGSPYIRWVNMDLILQLEHLKHLLDGLIMTQRWLWHGKYNFTPLSRGSGVVGFVVMPGLLLTANMEATESVPQGLQVDWEVILTSDLNSFVDSIKHWLYPSLKIRTTWKEYPEVQ
ncbi:hypothetical protein NE237_018717 [Protea cynaroides]|uniref:Uncharacterized protein n=1 Tax=Protea cynaroides TaxID=273540 RepID=A0A9Q0QP99_9MAGN|nr:hypothetical protein NE237_018717 [Protea cynaroides]